MLQNWIGVSLPNRQGNRSSVTDIHGEKPAFLAFESLGQNLPEQELK